MKKRYDVLVVGSGFGGAITAARLAQAGKSVAILEQGRRWHKQEFPRTIGQVSSRAFWQQGKSSGFLEYRAFRRMDVIQGVGLGGGSLHYFNVHLRADADVFEDPRWPQAITRTGLDPYYDLAQSMMDSKPLSPPAGLKMPSRTEVFLGAAKKADMTSEMVPLAVHTGEERRNPHGLVVQQACTYCGDCLYGCHIHAKNTLDITYIGMAERQHALEVFTLHRVDKIEKSDQDGAGYKVSFQRLSEAEAAPIETGEVHAGKVVLAAGTLGSTEILLRSRDEHRSLPRLGAAVGRRFSCNGEFLGAAAIDTTKSVDCGHGPSITARVDVSTKNHKITIEDLGLPDSMLWFLEGMLPPRGGRIARLLDLAGRAMAQALGFMSRRGPVRDSVDALFARSRTPRILPFLGMGMDASDGVFRLNKGRLDLDWDHAASREMYRSMHKRMRELSEAAGGRYATSPLWRWPVRKILTAHPLGGCAMGDDAETSVVNDRGEVHHYPGLYVIDGSMLPTALAINPSLTIAALAERASWWMLHDRDIREDEIEDLQRPVPER